MFLFQAGNPRGDEIRIILTCIARSINELGTTCPDDSKFLTKSPANLSSFLVISVYAVPFSPKISLNSINVNIILQLITFNIQQHTSSTSSTNTMYMRINIPCNVIIHYSLDSLYVN